MLSGATEDYLKTIFSLTRDSGRAGTKDIATKLGVSQASVTGYLQRLAGAELPLIDYRKREGAALTEEGRRKALRVIRNHRLLETFLHRMLGFSWDRVHDEACRLEHVISAEFEEKLDALLGYPTHDPHGDPIPGRDLDMPINSRIALAELEPGEEAVVDRVSDSDPELLSYLGKHAILPGTRLTVKAVSPFDRNMKLCVEKKRGTIVLGPLVTRQIFVERNA